MKIESAIFPALLAGVLLPILFSCQELNNANTPSIKVVPVTNVTATTASGGGVITSDGGSNIIARGVCWSTNQNPTIADFRTSDGTSLGSFTSSITGLTSGVTYYVRAYAINIAGTAYSEQVNFTTLVTDIDGNVYHTVTIGTQVWMVENLKVTHFNDGSCIPNIKSDREWPKLIIPAYCWYENDIANKDTYGALYNWHAAKTAKLCPAGWHVPSDAEWSTLTNYLGGSEVAGGKLKEAGNAHWKNLNEGATNESGFTALPGGRRASDDHFSNAAFYDLESFGY